MIRKNDKNTQKDIDSNSKITSYHYICEELCLNSIKARSTVIEVNVNLQTSSISILDNGDKIPVETFSKLGVETFEHSNKHEGTFLYNVCNLCNTYFTLYRDSYKYEKMIDINGEINVKDRVSNDRFCNGMEIHLNDIFKNLPVRIKSCNISQEIGLIIQIVERISIINPFISFTLYDSNDSKLLFSIKPHSKILYRYLSLDSNNNDIYNVKSNLIEFNIKDNLHCNGIISSLNNENDTKLYKQYLYINERPVLCKTIEKTVYKLWRKMNDNNNNNYNNKMNYVININLNESDYVIIPSCDNIDEVVIFFPIEKLEKLIQSLLDSIYYNNNNERRRRVERNTVNMNEYLNIDVDDRINIFTEYNCDDLYIPPPPVKRYYYSSIPSPYLYKTSPSYFLNKPSSELIDKWDNLLGITNTPINPDYYYLDEETPLPSPSPLRQETQTPQQQQPIQSIQQIPIIQSVNEIHNDDDDENYNPILLTKEEYREYKQLLKQPWLIPLQSEQSIEQSEQSLNNINLQQEEYDNIRNQFKDYEQCDANKIYEYNNNNNNKYKHNIINIKSYLTPSTLSRTFRKRRRISSSSSSDKFNFSKNDLKNCQVIGQFDKKFILFYCNNILFAIDQHAADERVHLEEYESLILSTNTQQIISEIDIFESSVINDRLYYILNENRDLIEKRGFKYNIKYNEKNEKKTMSIMNTVVHLDSLINYLEQLEKCNNKIINENEIPEYLNTILKSKACRNAIMFNDQLSLEECKELISKLSECNFPFMCAHGRPSIHPLFSLKETAI